MKKYKSDIIEGTVCALTVGLGGIMAGFDNALTGYIVMGVGTYGVCDSMYRGLHRYFRTAHENEQQPQPALSAATERQTGTTPGLDMC